MYEAIVQLYVVDRLGLIAEVTSILADMKVPIISINSNSRPNSRAIITMKIVCKNIDHYNNIVDRIRGLNGIEDIVRGFI